MKKLASIALAALIAVTASYATGEQETAAAALPVTLRLANGMPMDHPMNIGATRFKELVESRTNGKVKVEIFPSLQLGGNQEMWEGVTKGSIDITIQDCNWPENQGMKYYNLLQAGYTFTSWKQKRNFLQGPEFAEMNRQTEAKLGVVAIAPAWYYGTRHLTTKGFPVNHPADLPGKKIRVAPIPSMMNIIRGMGGTPVAVDFGELYMAMKTGIADGQENPTTTIIQQKMYEVQDYLMLTAHLISANSVFMNAARLRSLPKDYQAIITKSIAEAAALNEQLMLDREAKEVSELERLGMKVIKVDVNEFSRSVLNYYFTNSVFGADEQAFLRDVIAKYQ